MSNIQHICNNCEHNGNKSCPNPHVGIVDDENYMVTCTWFQENLKGRRDRLINNAVVAAREYAASCNVGPKRIKAFLVHERLFNSNYEG